MVNLVYKRGAEIKPILLNGEKIRELIGGSDNLGIGIASAEVEMSEGHYHRETREFYCVTKGVGEILLQSAAGQKWCYRISEGDVQYISPGVSHRARGLKVGGKTVPFEVLVISTPPWKKEDHHETELFWPEEKK